MQPPHYESEALLIGILGCVPRLMRDVHRKGARAMEGRVGMADGWMEGVPDGWRLVYIWME